MLCPTCKKPVPDPAENEDLPKYFPFCCERCKLIDLGRWLDGKYQIPVADPSEEEQNAGDAGDDDFLRRR